MKPVSKTVPLPYPNSSSISQLNQYDADMRRALVDYLFTIAFRLNSMVPNDASEAVSGILFTSPSTPSSNPLVLDAYKVGTWTPVLTFQTPGNLAVTYSNQQGRFQRVGNRCMLDMIVDTATFTHTTASGEFRITGIPYTAAGIANMQWTGTGEMGNGWAYPAGYTYMTANMTAGSNFVRFVANGSGVNRVALTAAHIPTGSVVSTRINITYETTDPA